MNDQLRFDLCCGARALYRAGLSVGIAGHLSIRIDDHTMLANRFGPSFGTLTPEDVLLLDYDGHVLEGRGAVNDTIRLHGVIHERNPSIVGVAHTHPPAVVTLGTMRVAPEIWDQEGCLLAGDVAVVEEDYSGLAATEDRVTPFADALRTADLAVNATTVGMIDPGMTIEVARLPASATVFDLVYVPPETPLLAAARARGLRAANGSEMLIAQAAIAFERWTGIGGMADVMREAVAPLLADPTLQA